MADEPSAFASVEEELAHWKELAALSKQQYEDYVESSQELEHEMETELRAKDREVESLTGQIKKLTQDMRDLQAKQGSGGGSVAGLVELQEEVERLRKSEGELKALRVRLEQDNDDLERSVRQMEAERNDAASRLEAALETSALLQVSEHCRGECTRPPRGPGMPTLLVV